MFLSPASVACTEPSTDSSSLSSMPRLFDIDSISGSEIFRELVGEGGGDGLGIRGVLRLSPGLGEELEALKSPFAFL